jgi:hypothetical protein
MVRAPRQEEARENAAKVANKILPREAREQAGAAAEVKARAKVEVAVGVRAEAEARAVVIVNI